MMMFVSAVSMVKYWNVPLMAHYNRRGCLTMYWVLNNEEDIRDVIRDSTVQCIMTDRPKFVQEILQKKNE